MRYWLASLVRLTIVPICLYCGLGCDRLVTGHTQILPLVGLNPTFSPDDQAIAFRDDDPWSDPVQHFIIVAREPFQRAAFRVRIPAGSNSNPQWAPDGKTIVYCHDGMLFKISLSDGKTTPLHRFAWPRFSPARPGQSFSGGGGLISLSPDGSRLAGIVAETPPPPLDSDPGNLVVDNLAILLFPHRRATQTSYTTPWAGVCGLGDWSPDGRKLAFTVSSRAGSVVWCEDTETLTFHRIIEDAQFPTFGPNGDVLACYRQDKDCRIVNTGRIIILGTDKTIQAELTANVWPATMDWAHHRNAIVHSMYPQGNLAITRW